MIYVLIITHKNGKGNDTHEQNSSTETHTEDRVTKIEEKLEALSNRVAKLEGALTAIQHNNFGASNNYKRVFLER